jgi:hypothetical protein
VYNTGTQTNAWGCGPTKYLRPTIIALLALGAVTLLLRGHNTGPASAQAAFGATITVNDTGYTDSRDGVLTLREAMELVRASGPSS